MMEHLKIFEEYNQYYWEISNEEYIKDRIESIRLVFPTGGSVGDPISNHPFTNKEVTEIYSFFPSITNHISKIPRYNTFTLYLKREFPSLLRIYFEFTKLEDEWYLLSLSIYYDNNTISKKNFKCDQFEGLIKCIKDSLIIQ